jgi:hypothetical protein
MFKPAPNPAMQPTAKMHVYEVRPRKDKRGVDLISDVPPFGRLWYGEPDAISNAIGYAKFYSRSHDVVISVYDDAGKLIEVHGHKGDFKNHDRPYSADCRCRIGPRIRRIQIPCSLSRDVHLRRPSSSGGRLPRSRDKDW